MASPLGQHRQSRLLQPASRLSFASPSSPSLGRVSGSATFQLQNSYSNPTTAPSSDHYQVASADISGLPAPRQRLIQSAGAEPLAVPSTVGSALRRRQPSPAAASPALNRLPSPALRADSSYSVRRSQSQRPQASFGLQRPLASSTSGPFAFKLRAGGQQATSRLEANNRAEEEEDDEEEAARAVESLPPLKSASYICRLSGEARGSQEAGKVAGETLDASRAKEPRSEPALRTARSSLAATTTTFGQLQKPSQLVKPLPSSTATSGGKRSLSSSRLAPAAAAASRQPERQTSQLSMLPSYGSSQLKPTATGRLGGLSSKVPAPKEAAEQAPNRRLSLQPASRPLQSRLKVQPASKNGKIEDVEDDVSDDYEVDADGEGDEDQEEEDDGEEEEHDNDEEEEEATDEEDDATTATTIQTSDNSQGPLASASRELNSMIQMLSSSAILSDSDRLISQANRRRSSVESSQQQRVPRVKSSNGPVMARQVLKSQSVSFGQSCVASRGNKSIRSLPRPRSRIVFDPTSSQFHVSCSLDDSPPTANCQSSESESDDDDDKDESLSLEEQLAGDLLRPAGSATSGRDSIPVAGETNRQYPAVTRSLISAQSQLKCLPRLGADQPDGRHDSDTIRRLKDCRGSLESLVTITSGQSGGQAEAQVEAQEPRRTPDSRRRSPVGSALRSLFGLGQQQQPVADVASQRQPVAGSRKLATIVRHSSLRTDPRLGRLSPGGPSTLDRKPSLGPVGEAAPAPEQPLPRSHLGSDLLQRAGKRLSASSSSLTNRFKHIISSSPPPPISEGAHSKVSARESYNITVRGGASPRDAPQALGNLTLLLL